MKAIASRRWDSEMLLVAYAAALVSLISFLFYFRHGWILLYGDAVAHINIARRVFDSRTPGLLQLGTVWLPLPHLLMIPFLLSERAWRSGIGGSIPSLLAYVLGTVGIFRLLRQSLSSLAGPRYQGKAAASCGTAIYAGNPNLIYLQTTAMTEALYLALLIWSVVFFYEFVRVPTGLEKESSRSLLACGFCVAAAELTRYDGWFLAAVLALAAPIVMARQKRWGRRSVRLQLRNFLLLICAVPALWLLYNGMVYHNPLEFETGPYSARAIEQRTARPGYPPHPGTHNVVAATKYFLKSAQLNLGQGIWQKPWLLVALAGGIWVLFLDLRLASLGLLWTPVAFYGLSIAYGGVPLFVPSWWPFSYYNLRYGIQLLPASAVFLALATYLVANAASWRPPKLAIYAAVVVFVIASYISVWHAQPVCFKEAWINSRTRLALEKELASNLRRLPPHATFLMYLGDHVGALELAGIPLQRVINEGNHRVWEQPSDPTGLWERALASPENLVDYVIGFDSDQVEESARQHRLPTIAIIETPGQPRATIYLGAR